MRDDCETTSLSTEEVDPALASQSGIVKGRAAGHVDGSDPSARVQIRPRSSSDSVCLRTFWVRVEPTGKEMCEMIHRPFHVLVSSNAPRLVRDLKRQIYDYHTVPPRNQSITHLGTRLRNRVDQDVFY